MQFQRKVNDCGVDRCNHCIPVKTEYRGHMKNPWKYNFNDILSNSPTEPSTFVIETKI